MSFDRFAGTYSDIEWTADDSSSFKASDYQDQNEAVEYAIDDKTKAALLGPGWEKSLESTGFVEPKAKTQFDIALGKAEALIRKTKRDILAGNHQAIADVGWEYNTLHQQYGKGTHLSGKANDIKIDEAFNKHGIMQTLFDAGFAPTATGWGSGWDESKHPRYPAGTSKGGEFAPKGGTAEPSKSKKSKGGKHIPDKWTEKSILGYLSDQIDPKLAKTLLNNAMKWMKSISDDERNAVKEYTGNAYAVINPCLRNNAGCDEPHGSIPVKDYATTAKAALKTSKLPVALTVYRAMDNVYKKQLAVGKIILDKGFASTTLKRGVSYGLGEANDLRLEINLPKGARAQFLDGLSSSSHELEVLLAPGSKLKVEKITKEGSHTYVTASYVK